MYREVSDIPGDIYLDESLGKIQIVVPEETTNLVINPSVEENTTGYTGVNSTMTRISTEQRRGIFSLQCVPVAAGWSGLYYGTISLTAGELYTLSVDVKASSGSELAIYFADTSGNQLGKLCKVTASGEWQRVWVTYGETSSTTRRVYILQRTLSSTLTDNLYVDGLQVENKGYRTTYCDGDLQGYIVDNEDYVWNGTPHASTSTRSGDTASGGKIVDLMDYVDGIIELTGSEMIPVEMSLSGESNDGYESYLDTVNKPRRFIISCEVSHKQIRDLSILLHSSRTHEPQPILLRVDKNGGNNYEQDVYLLKTVYKGGLEGETGNGYWEKVALEFDAVEPMIYKDGDHAQQITIPAFDLPNYIVKLSRDMEWILFSYGSSNGFDDDVYAITEAPNGTMYFGGNFTADGDGNSVKGLAYWNGTRFMQCDIGVSPGVLAMAFGNDGNLYFGGLFTTAGDAGALLRAGMYNPDTNTLTQLGDGLNGTVYAIGLSPDGIIYLAGDFTQDGLGNTMNYVAYWDGAVLVNAGVGLTSKVYDIEWDNNGQLVVGGPDYLIGTVGTGQSAVAYWDGTQFVGMGNSLTNTDRATAVSLGRLQDGSIIAVPSDDLSYPPDKFHIFQWDGNNWNAVGDRFHVYNIGSGNIDNVTGYACSNSNAAVEQNKIVVTVDVSPTLGGYISDRRASAMQFYWDGMDWQSLPYHGYCLSLDNYIDSNGNIYFGFPEAEGFNIAGRVTIDYAGTFPTYPEIIFFGEARPYSIQNVTTLDRIYFRDCIIQEGDYIKIACDNAGIVTVTNRNKRHFTGIISAGSDTGNFKLLRGDNIITALATKYDDISAYDTVDTIYLKWRECFWNLV